MLSAWGSAEEKWHLLPGTFLWKYQKYLGMCRCKEHFFARHFLWTYRMCLGKCRCKEILCQAFFYENIKSAWGSAEAKNTFCQALFYENIKSAWESADAKNTFLAGTLRKYRTLFINKHIISALNFDKNCLGWTLLKTALGLDYVFHFQAKKLNLYSLIWYALCSNPFPPLVAIFFFIEQSQQPNIV